MLEAGIKLWHIENNKTISMFKTSIPTVPSGGFSGNLVVSMRSIPNAQVDLVVELSRNYPLAHGAPIHIGNPFEIGIADLSQPDWGDVCPIQADETPVFWACGVTPQVAVENTDIPIFITHKPGHMLITDVDQYAETPICLTNN